MSMERTNVRGRHCAKALCYSERRLERSGAIRGYRAVIDPVALGVTVRALVVARLREHSPPTSSVARIWILRSIDDPRDTRGLDRFRAWRRFPLRGARLQRHI
jgi:DNA-binding Lrp family transcriptional regulator